jgi:redox-sensitive bicupin YhaK (pirin superfamily)
VKTFSPMFYLAVEAEAGAAIPLPGDYEERAAYVVSGRLSVHGSPLEASRMAAFRPGSSPSLRAEVASRVMLLGGAPLGARHIWWNFVASRQERIDQARRDWEESAEKGYSGTPFALPPGENAFIPPPQS